MNVQEDSKNPFVTTSSFLQLLGIDSQADPHIFSPHSPAIFAVVAARESATGIPLCPADRRNRVFAGGGPRPEKERSQNYGEENSSEILDVNCHCLKACPHTKQTFFRKLLKHCPTAYYRAISLSVPCVHQR